MPVRRRDSPHGTFRRSSAVHCSTGQYRRRRELARGGEASRAGHAL